MTEDFSEDMLFRVVAQICKMVGFNSVFSSTIYVLTDIMRQLILYLGKRARSYSELCGRTHVELSDLSCTFADLHIYPSELVDFFQTVGRLPLPIRVPKYPVVFRSDQVMAGGNPVECVDIKYDKQLGFSPIGSLFPPQNRVLDSSNCIEELNESAGLNRSYLRENIGRHFLAQNRELDSSNRIEELNESTDLNQRYRQENSGVDPLNPNFTEARESLKVTISIAGIKKAHKKKVSKKQKKKVDKTRSKKKKKKKSQG